MRQPISRRRGTRTALLSLATGDFYTTPPLVQNYVPICKNRLHMNIISKRSNIPGQSGISQPYGEGRGTRGGGRGSVDVLNPPVRVVFHLLLILLPAEMVVAGRKDSRLVPVGGVVFSFGRV